MIEQQLYTQLTTFPGLAALIGDRVYPQQLPQGVQLDAITYTNISLAPVQDRDSRAATYSRDRYQIDGWSASFDGAVALRRQIVLAMGAWRVTSAPRVDVALLAGGRGDLEAEAGRYRVTLDYMISHEEG